MANSKKSQRSKRVNRGSLLSPEQVGGITAGKGLDFQKRYAACHLPIWLQDPTFQQLFFEGTGDIDVRFSAGGKSSRIHIQVKDHEVSASELKSILEQFHNLDSALPLVYKQFTLACPSLSSKVRPIETGLARFRGAKPFYDDAPGALTPTKEELDERFRKAGLTDYIEFIHSKVSIEVGHGDLCHDDRALELFIARLLSHPEYSGRLREMVQPAFSELMRTIGAHMGVVLERRDIDNVLRAAVATGGISEPQITIWVQNWTSESFEPPADYTLDWSQHFDRASRRVPSPEVWNRELLPELNSLKKQILRDRTERVIQFRGKCALSTGIALGAIFPAVGGWIFEIPQPPSKENWRSDIAPTVPYDLKVEVSDIRSDGDDLVLGLNIRGDARGEIVRYIQSTGSQPKLFAFMSPASVGAQSIGGSADACAFAQGVREHLGRLLKEHGLHRTRVFFYGPLALAVFLGQQLTSVGDVQLFEYQDPGYVPSCLLST